MNPLDDLTLPVIDPRNADILTAEAIQYALQSGTITNILPNDPLDVLIRTQVFSQAELLWYVNKLPKALLVEFLNQTKVTAKVSAKARYLVQFSLSLGQASYQLPAGYEVRTGNGLRYRLVQPLVWTPFVKEAIGEVEAMEAGTSYNVPPASINRIIVSFNFLSRVVGLSQTVVGSDPEAPEVTLARQLATLSTRVAVTQDDYELLAQDVLGAGSEALAVGRLGLNTDVEELGAVHLFVLNANKQSASQTQANLVLANLLPKVQAGTRLYVSPMPTQGVDITSTLALLPTANSADVLPAIDRAVRRYFADSLTAGQAVYPDEVSYVIRGVTGVAYVSDTTVSSSIDGLVSPVIPEAYERLVYRSLRLEVTQGTSLNTVLYGEGDPD